MIGRIFRIQDNTSYPQLRPLKMFSWRAPSEITVLNKSPFFIDGNKNP